MSTNFSLSVSSRGLPPSVNIFEGGDLTPVNDRIDVIDDKIISIDANIADVNTKADDIQSLLATYGIVSPLESGGILPVSFSLDDGKTYPFTARFVRSGYMRFLVFSPFIVLANTFNPSNTKYRVKFNWSGISDDDRLALIGGDTNIQLMPVSIGWTEAPFSDPSIYLSGSPFYRYGKFFLFTNKLIDSYIDFDMNSIYTSIDNYFLGFTCMWS